MAEEDTAEKQPNAEAAPVEDASAHSEDEAKIAEQQRPERGQGVHYVAEHGDHQLAVVVAVFEDGSAELQVLDASRPAGAFRASPIGRDNGKSVGTWHYPEE